MSFLDKWTEQKCQLEAAIAAGTVPPEQVARDLAHLEYRIRRRPLILKRRRDRKQWREAQAANRG